MLVFKITHLAKHWHVKSIEFCKFWEFSHPKLGSSQRNCHLFVCICYIQKQPQKAFYKKKGVLKFFDIHRSLFLNNVDVLRPVILLKKETLTQVLYNSFKSTLLQNTHVGLLLYALNSKASPKGNILIKTNVNTFSFSLIFSQWHCQFSQTDKCQISLTIFKIKDQNFTFNFLTHTFRMHLFSTPWKRQKIVRFSDVFRE